MKRRIRRIRRALKRAGLYNAFHITLIAVLLTGFCVILFNVKEPEQQEKEPEEIQAEVMQNPETMTQTAENIEDNLDEHTELLKKMLTEELFIPDYHKPSIADDLKDIKRESRENREEMKTLRERVVIVEQSLKSYHKRLDGEQHSDR